MLEKVIFTPEAADDVAEAYAWYEEPSLGLEKISYAVLRHASCRC